MRDPHALLIDLDGVLRRWPDVAAAAEQISDLPPGSLHEAAFAPALLEAAVTGAIDDDEWRRRVAETLADTYGPARAGATVAAWSEPPGEVDAATLRVLDELGPQVRVLLVTNATSRLRADLSRLGLVDRFFAIVNSSEVGAAKPDARIFRHALEVAQAAPAQAAFVDDAVANVRAAAELGIPSHHFAGADGLRSFLTAGGLLL